MVQAEGDFTYASGWSSAAVSDGSGGTFPDGYSWQAAYGDLIANGTFYDANQGQNYAYEVYSDGSNGYYISQSPI
jgi:hypothetical protein